MIKILVMSDTHANHKLLGSVLKLNQDCNFLIHLGDEPDDLDYHMDLTRNMQIFYVYGLSHNRWTKKNASLNFAIQKVDFSIAHAKEYLEFKNTNCIYCFGHTHHRHFEQHNDTILLNPGHLKNKSDRNEVAGYATIMLSENTNIVFYDYEGNLLDSHEK